MRGYEGLPLGVHKQHGKEYNNIILAREAGAVMRTTLVVALMAALLSLFLTAVQAGPTGLSAGTAAGKVGVASKTFQAGVHYPHGPSQPRGYYSMKGASPKPFNATAPYNEWPDSAKVPGIRTRMSAEIVIIGSSKKK